MTIRTTLSSFTTTVARGISSRRRDVHSASEVISGSSSDEARPMKRRTLAGDADAEARIERDLGRIAATAQRGLGDDLRALLLVGGYARGEGSLVAHADGLGPYNDYNLVAVMASHASRWHGTLARVGAELSGPLGVDVDLWPMDEATLPHVPATLFWLDIALGGRETIAGDPAVEGAIRTLTPRQVPLDECGRLLANRAVGLALSNLEVTDHDLRRARHGHKAVLACGDVQLLAADRYLPTVAERLEQLEQLAGAPAVGETLVEAYRDAVAFRARPDLWRPPGGDLNRWYATTRERIGMWHLAYEAFRVGSPPSPAAFGAFRGRLFPAMPDVRPGGAIVSALRLRAQGVGGLLPWVGHPRERLARVAVALAYGHQAPGARAAAARLLALPVTADDERMHAALEALALRGG